MSLKELFIFKLSDHAWKDDWRTGTTETDTSVMQKNKEIKMLYLTGQESIYNITSGKHFWYPQQKM